MLHMFRRYERAMFIVIAIVIIISFSFFGTYSTFQGHHYEDPVVFTTLNKHPVKRSELDQVIVFIGTDSTDKRNLGGARGANGLNDGFIANDLLKTGLASLLIGQMREQLSQELRTRLEKEKQFSFYTHPQAPFISAQSLWGMFAPQIGHNLSGLRAVTDPTSEDGLKARAELYLAERQFPEMNLKQLVRYQERQFPWVRPDPNLAQLDLSLFGYHTVGDWYGSDFVKLAAEFLIDAAELAEQAGYEVSDNEALADLQRIASDSLSQLRRLPQYEQLLPSQYLNEQLAQMRLDEPRAVAIWKQVLLFRRLFHGTGNAVLVDTLPYEQFNSFALESISGERFSLADSLQFGDLNALARFETYLNLVAAKPSQGSLELPTEAKAIAVLAKQTPELVQKRYLVETASITLTALQSRVSVKEMWDWQTSDKGWNQLVREFPQLSFAKNSQPPQTDNERFQALKAVQESTRTKVDEFSRLAIIREHPEWVDEALDAEKMERKIYSIRLKGGPSPVEGLSDRSALLALLDAAPVAPVDSEQKPPIAPQLARFSADNHHFYRIALIDRPPSEKQLELVPFSSVRNDSFLDERLDSELEPFYARIRTENPSAYRKDDQTYRPLKDVREIVLKEYFKPLLSALSHQEPKQELDTAGSANNWVGLRLLKQMQSVRRQLVADSTPKALSQLTETSKQGLIVGNALPPAPSLTDQWKPVMDSYRFVRKDEGSKSIDPSLFSLDANTWSEVQVGEKGNLWFVQVTQRSLADEAGVLSEQIDKTRALLSNEVQKIVMEQTLEAIRRGAGFQLDVQEKSSGPI